MVSSTQWTWTWAHSGRRWGTVHGSWKVRHNLATEHQQIANTVSWKGTFPHWENQDTRKPQCGGISAPLFHSYVALGMFLSCITLSLSKKVKIIVVAALMVVLRFESGHSQKVLTRVSNICVKTHLKVNIISFYFCNSEARKMLMTVLVWFMLCEIQNAHC